MGSFDDRGYRWAEITDQTDTANHERRFVRGARLDVPGARIEQLASELGARGWGLAADKLRELLR